MRGTRFYGSAFACCNALHLFVPIWKRFASSSATTLRHTSTVVTLQSLRLTRHHKCIMHFARFTAGDKNRHLERGTQPQWTKGLEYQIRGLMPYALIEQAWENNEVLKESVSF